MTPQAAGWVYDVVLTQRYKESIGAIMWTGARENRRDEGKGAAFLSVCPCQYGPCGRCGDGRPELCKQKPVVSPETRILSPNGWALTPVWRSGRPCCWVCPTVARPAEPEPEPAVVQLELFALAGAS